MFTTFLITFREALEAALVTGIVLSYLAKTEHRAYFKYVWSAIGIGIGASILGAYLFNVFAGGFTGKAEEVFEGAVMLIGAALLTTMIFWIMKRQNSTEQIHSDIKQQVSQENIAGIFLIVFLSILREGIETVVFLNAAAFVSSEHHIGMAMAGIAVAVLLSVALFKGVMQISLKKFFRVTNILLILFAAGLVAHGVHELQEAGLVPIFIEHIWDINPAVLTEGIYPAFHEKGAVGGILKGLFGYNGNPSLIEVMSYGLYMVGIAFVWKRRVRAEA